MSSRVASIGGRIVLILLAAIGLLWPLAGSLFTTTVGAADDPVVITELRSEFTVEADGHMSVTERVTADFPAYRHGIFRYWDVSDPSDPAVRHVPTIREITADGASVPFDTYSEGNGRFLVAKIGDPDAYLAEGRHTYTIAYAIDGVISSAAAGAGGSFESSEGQVAPGSGSTFYWNVVAQGWEMPIRSAHVTIDLPSPSGLVQCSAGYAIGPGPLWIAGAGTAELTLTAGDLPARSGMTVRASMAPPAPGPARASLVRAMGPRPGPLRAGADLRARRVRRGPGPRVRLGSGPGGRTPPDSRSSTRPRTASGRSRPSTWPPSRTDRRP